MDVNPTEKKYPSILITGASGFLGKRMVEELLSDDSPLKARKIKLLDIKPYVPAFDDRPGAVVGWLTGSGTHVRTKRSDGRFG